MRCWRPGTCLNDIEFRDVATWSGAGGAEDGVRFVVSLTDVPELGVETGSAGGNVGTLGCTIGNGP